MPKNPNEIRLRQPTVSQLMDVLRTLPAKSKVLLSVDEEQNALANDIFIINYQGEVVFLPLNPETGD